MRKARLMIGAAACSGLVCGTASAGIRPLNPGEQVVYQTVQSGTNYRSFYTQITGNAYTNYGDEILLGGTNRYATNIAVGTQIFANPATPGYMDGVNSQPPTPGFEDTGGFLELTIFLNDGPADSASDDPFVEATPTGQVGPGTILAKARVPTPSYPNGGTNRSSNGLNDPDNAADNASDPWIVEFPFANVLLPEKFTFALCNLNAAGVADGYNFDGNQFGLWHVTHSTTNVDPDANTATFNNNTTYNTALVGQSRSGPHVGGPFSTNNGQYTWVQYNGPRNSPTPWESDRDQNSGAEATMYALAAAQAATVYWDTDGFNTAGAGGAAPSGNWNGTTLNFNSNATGTGPGMVKAATTTGDTVVFGAGGAATGTYTVTVSGTQSAAAVNIEEGDVTFTGGTLATGSFDVSAGASGTVNSAINGGATNSLSKNGDGTLTVDGAANTYTGATNANAGTLVINNGLKTGSSLTVNDGATAVVPEQSPNTYDGAMVVPSGQDSSGSKVSSLSISGSGVLDLGNSDLAIDYSTGSPLDDVVALLVAGYNGGGWDGTGGIVTNTLNANNPNQLDPGVFGLGYAENGDLPSPYGNLEAQGGPLFSDQDVDLSTVLIKFTWVGDLNLDGLVDFQDLSVFNTNYDNGATTGRYWFEGDFNYDGSIDFSDLSLFNTNYDPNKPSLPEPSALAGLGFAIAAGAMRRTRRTR